MNDTNNITESQEGFQVVVNKNRGEKKQRPDRREVLSQVASGNLKPEDADKMLRDHRPPRFVVRNGAITLYNLGNRAPITLYADQWEKLSSMIERGILRTYMERNKHLLKRRPATMPETSETLVEE